MKEDTSAMDAPEVSYVRSPASRSQYTSDTVVSGRRTGHRNAPRLADPFQHEDSSASGSQESSASSDVVVGQFSFPAIKKTVVTTTTTTTTTFPPIVMKAPQQLFDLDSKMYPLAASPTPPSMRELRFNVGGKQTIFSEAADPLGTLDEYKYQNKRLRNSQQIVQTSVDDMTDEFGSREGSKQGYIKKEETPAIAWSSPTSSASTRIDKTPPGGSVKTRSSQRMLGRQRRVASRQTPLGQNDVPRLQRSSSKLQIMQTSTPVTPHMGLRGAELSDEGGNSDGNRRGSDASPFGEDASPARGRQVAQTLSPQPESSLRRSKSRGTNDEPDLHQELAITTPPVDSQSSTDDYTSRPRPAALNTASAQDASLPSPSLSPVTAAANLQARSGASYFDHPSQRRRLDITDEKYSRRSAAGLGLLQDDLDSKSMVGYHDDSIHPKFSMMDLPDMVDAFDAMPTDMKSYMMYQLLRRCPKPSLRFIADVVNPALKCDFLTLLPPELSQLIISQLDLKSLCRAAQVSRKWRSIIDGDEKVWKQLFDKEGFTLAPGELRRAILEGWGWQHCSSISEAEQNLGSFEASAEGSLEALAQSPSSDRSPSHTESRRNKRKAAKHRTTSRKIQKRRVTPSKEFATFDTEAIQKHIKSAEGPFAAAQVAKLAIPCAEQGLPQLRSMTFYKSIYRRHHLIEKGWMQDIVKPRHIAFSAHANHVVTCLEFDSDKIITGSDDTNINIYDTTTGALRATLAGHEGGVWALKYEGNMLVSGSTDRSVRIWDIKRGACVHVFHGHTSTVRCLLIVMPTEIGKTSDGRPIIMPKEPVIVTGSRDSTLRVWRLPMPDDEPTFNAGTAQGQGSANANGSGSGAAGAADHTESPYFVRTLAGHGHSVRAIAAHGDTLVSGSYDFSVRVWRISTGETVHRLTGHSQKVYSVVLDHERGQCISGSMDNLVKIWSLETGQCVYNLEGHSSLVGLLDLQRDRLVSAAADFTLRIWDPSNGKCNAILSAHTGAITCFQHDGHKVISGSDRNLKMWDVRTGQFVRDLLTDLTGVWQVKFDEHRCVAAVQRDQLTYLEVLDFSASRDGLPEGERGRRIVVNSEGEEIPENSNAVNDMDDAMADGPDNSEA